MKKISKTRNSRVCSFDIITCMQPISIAAQCHNNKISFRKNYHKTLNAHPWKQGMGCVLWIQCLIYILLLSLKNQNNVWEFIVDWWKSILSDFPLYFSFFILNVVSLIHIVVLFIIQWKPAQYDIFVNFFQWHFFNTFLEGLILCFDDELI